MTREEEIKLVEWLDFRARNNIPIDVDILRNQATKFVKNKDFKACEDWAQGFIQQWNIDKGTPQVQDICRARSKTEGAVRSHFDMLGKAKDIIYERNGWDPNYPLPDGAIGNGDEKPVVTRMHVILHA